MKASGFIISKMNMEEKKEPQQPQQPPVLDQLKEYVETRIQLGKYKAIEKSSSVAASLVTDVVAAVCGVLFLLFFFITLALLLGSVLGAAWKGFGIVTLLYLIIAFVVIKMKPVIQKSIINLLINKIFK
ncbi:hypothetical protein HH214_12430 [Mucilaginibacter robiniae]|uniref:Phage holin family protein n=1 Tax=Mucilaginibacter robiniae TaxID=2728022 RepID=A0A7L5DZT1_9SPHI|nr:phage holin family protein [Mucilaginibacter robiniae]QJD96630.1 hypothetical protein HH214_12430 [Mucilaginibacter robiniae]